MNKENIIIIWLTIQLTLASFMWLRAEKKAAYLAGRQAIYDNSHTETDGTDKDYKWIENVPTDKKGLDKSKKG